MGNIRLDKYLADMGVGSRSQVKQLLKKGVVQVNGTIQKYPDSKIDLKQDIIKINGKTIIYQAYEYYMLNKPSGCVTATEDNYCKTVMDYIKTKDTVRKQDLFPVGRLDKDTEGLLLITNDGALAHNLLSPRKHVGKTYFVMIDDPITEEDIAMLETGVSIGDDKPTLPAGITIMNHSDRRQLKIRITEGRFHQVKRMFEAVGKSVVYLKRLSMGSLHLDDSLHPGEYRKLMDEEIHKLYCDKSQGKRRGPYC